MNSISILMATYNGARFLEEQLLSIEKQTYPHWHLYVLDDGSKDDTWAILDAFQQRVGTNKITLRQGHHQGCVKTFLSLVCDKTITSDFYAYADQDDVWDSDKLERAVKVLKNHIAVPFLYCSSSRLIDENGKIMGRTSAYTRPPSFKNALVQNIAAGHTMVFNKQARNLLKNMGVVGVFIHDWWTYIVVTACGGGVYFDAQPSVSYRQHSANLIGINSAFKSFHNALKRVWKGEFKGWTESHLFFLSHMKDPITGDAKKTIDCLACSRQKSLFMRVIFFIKSGVFHQTILGNLKLLCASLVNKI